MALKFRRGTTAQKSGSLAFGEPYVNTTLGALQVGLESGDITISSIDSASVLGVTSVSSSTFISASSLKVTGNATIDGNLTLGGTITIGDSTSDNVVVNADLSSSLIPNNDNVFDIGGPNKTYKTIYGGIISGSALEIMSGSNPEVRLFNNTTGIEYHIQNGDGGHFQIHNGTTNNLLFKFLSGSVLDGNQDAYFYSNLFVSESINADFISAPNISHLTTFTGSANNRLTNLETTTASLNGHVTDINTKTGSFETKFGNIQASTASLNAFTASNGNTSLNTFSASVNGHITDINTKTGSFETKFGAIQASTSSLNTFSASVNGHIADINTKTGSFEAKFTTLAGVTASFNTATASLNTFSASALTRFIRIEESTASINLTTASLNGQVSDINTKTGSFETKFSTLATYTASIDTKFSTLQTLTASVNAQISRLQESTASINLTTASLNGHVADINTWSSSAKLQLTDIQSYTSSLRAAITASGVDVTINGNTTVKGNLFVQGTQTVVDSTTVNIADSVLVLNAAGTSDGGLQVRDASGASTTSGSLLWDVTNDYWKLGKSGSESQVLTAGGMGIVSGSNQIASVLTSLNSYTSSQDTKNTTLQSYTASVDTKFTTIQGVTASFNTATASLNTFSASALTRFTRIEESTASINLTTASLNGHVTDINTKTGSFETKFGAIQASTASLNAFTASQQNLNATYVTTGSNTLKGNQVIIGTGVGFAAYISTSVNDGTLGLDTTANVNATYFLKNGTKNFEVSYDTTNANGIFRLLPYNNNSFFEIGNPANSGNSNTDYVFVAESTYGNVLLGPGIGNATAYLGGATPLTDKVQVAGNLFVSGAVKANSFTGSIAATNGVVSGSSQVVGILSSLNTYTGSNDTTNTAQNSRLTNLESATASLFIDTNNLEVFSASVLGHIVDINTKTGSFETKFTTLQTLTASISTQISRIQESTASINLTTASLNGHVTDINTKTGSFETKFSTIQTYTASLETKNTTLANVTASLLSSQTNLNAFSASNGNTSLNTYTSSLNTAIQLTGSTVSFLGNIVVYGTQSVINSTNVEISDNILYLAPTASIDNDLGIVGHYNDGTYRHAGIFMDASDGHAWKVFNGLQGETSATIDTAGTGFTLADFKAGAFTGTSFTGTSFNGTINSTNGVVSGSSQVNFTQLSGISANIISASTDSSNVDFIISGGSITANLFGGVVSGSAQVVGMLSSLNTYTGSNDTTNTAQNSRLSNIESTTSSLATTYEGRATASKTIFSGSSQVDHNSTTNYVANRHIDHTAVSITAGNGLTGGGDISTTRTLTLDTTSATFTTGVTAQNNALAVVSGSKTISGITLGSNLATLTIGTGLSGTSYNGSTAVTIANTGVTSLAGTTNQVSVSGTTGAVTLSTPQDINTSSNVRFGSLGIGVAASGTSGRIDAAGDIVAYSSSDKNFKENIIPIPNALEKISKISGNTYDWKSELKDVHGYEGNDVGVIAQEIEEVLPQIVTTRDNGYKAVKYEKLVALLIEGIKEQQTQIHNLTLQVEELKKQKGL